jgi:hypothetical protein
MISFQAAKSPRSGREVPRPRGSSRFDQVHSSAHSKTRSTMRNLPHRRILNRLDISRFCYNRVSGHYGDHFSTSPSSVKGTTSQGRRLHGISVRPICQSAYSKRESVLQEGHTPPHQGAGNRVRVGGLAMD